MALPLAFGNAHSCSAKPEQLRQCLETLGIAEALRGCGHMAGVAESLREGALCMRGAHSSDAKSSSGLRIRDSSRLETCV
jgi:hypothetical protein